MRESSRDPYDDKPTHAPGVLVFVNPDAFSEPRRAGRCRGNVEHDHKREGIPRGVIGTGLLRVRALHRLAAGVLRLAL
jgi:hypothetical protein